METNKPEIKFLRSGISNGKIKIRGKQYKKKLVIRKEKASGDRMEKQKR